MTKARFPGIKARVDRPSAEWMSHPLAEEIVRCASAELKCLKSGKDPEVKRKANEIIAASEKDIADLNKWKSQKGTTNR